MRDNGRITMDTVRQLAVVLRDPITLSPGQIAAYRKLFPHGNTRPLMPLGARKVSRAGW